MTIDIIGAGIGGLTTAIALEQKGFKVRIFEQAETIKPIGAGIILASNAMQVYKSLGLKTLIESQGNSISSMNITKANLKTLSKIDLSYFENKHEVKNIAIHRGVLQRLLIDSLKSAEIYLNHKLKSVVKVNASYTLEFENDKTHNSNIVIGADGLNSVVRQQLFNNNHIRNANQVCWRGVTDFKLPEPYRNELNEAWGNAERFGFVQITKNKVYWYALKSFKKDINECSLKQIDSYFNSYNSIIKDIITATPKQHINTAEISDLKPTKEWYQDNLCLIGDAAHATTPNMGQGACQAIEDAYILSECLSKYETCTAFKTFQETRLPKAHKVVQSSWVVGKMAHISNPVLRTLRNFMLRLTPATVNRKQNERLFQLGSV